MAKCSILLTFDRIAPDMYAFDGAIKTVIEKYSARKIFLSYTDKMRKLEEKDPNIFIDPIKDMCGGAEIIRLTDYIITDTTNSKELFNTYKKIVEKVFLSDPGREIIINASNASREMEYALTLAATFFPKTRMVNYTEIGGSGIVQELDSSIKNVFTNEQILRFLIEKYDYKNAYSITTGMQSEFVNIQTRNVIAHAYLRSIGKYDEAFERYEDNELNIKLLITGDCKKYIGDAYEDYMSAKFIAKNISDEYCFNKFIEVAKKLAAIVINTNKYIQYLEDKESISAILKSRKLNLKSLKEQISLEGENIPDFSLSRDIIRFCEKDKEIPENVQTSKHFDFIAEKIDSLTMWIKMGKFTDVFVKIDEYFLLFDAFEAVFTNLSPKINNFSLYNTINEIIKETFIERSQSRKTPNAEIDPYDDDPEYTYYNTHILDDDELAVYERQNRKVTKDEIKQFYTYFHRHPETYWDYDHITSGEMESFIYHDGDSENDDPPFDNAVKADEVPPVAFSNEKTPEFFTDCYRTKGKQNYVKMTSRDKVIKQILETLLTKNKPNPLLVGPAGVGKTMIVEELARRMAEKDESIPEVLYECRILELNLNNLVSGCVNVGMLEDKIKIALAYANNHKKNTIIFIDEIHMLLSNDEQTFGKISQAFKPALARGAFRCIGATTTQESTKFHNDPALDRRFVRVIVDELSKAQTLEALKSTIPSFILHYDATLHISDDILNNVIDIADRFNSAGSHRPDNAITLLDRSIAKAVVDRKDHNAPPVITNKLIKKTAMQMVKGSEERAYADFSILREKLSVIKGQDEIIDKLLEIIRRDERGLFPRKKPLTILFAGKSGVGKTEITKILSEYITQKPPIALNMTEYTGDSTWKILGAVQGYKGSDSNTELPFDSLVSNPYQFILLDEFEKCHKSVQRLFMSVFDEGYLNTNRGTVVDFSKAIIIATTNAGNKDMRPAVGFGESPQRTNKELIKELEKWFDNELLTRFEHIIDFKAITEDIYMEIIENTYRIESERIREEFENLSLPEKIDEKTLAKLRKEFIPDLGARPAEKAVTEYIENTATELIAVPEQAI